MDGFRILEITQPSELHVTANQLTIEQEIAPKKKRKVSVPLEDLELIICTGANIRLSTMALSVLSENKTIITLILKNDVIIGKGVEIDGYLIIDKDEKEHLICKNHKKIIYKLLENGEGKIYEKIRGYAILRQEN